MNKKINKIFSFLMSLSFLAGCSTTSSSGQTSNNLPSIEDPSFYTNKFDEEKIPDQWTEYGVGDPFVLRYNGRYYLYCSTKNFEVGVRGWVSDDLINFTPITGAGLEKGYVSNDECTLGAYAPKFPVTALNGPSGFSLLKI